MAPTIFVLNGPNLNLLGTREPAIYGGDTLEDVRRLCEAAARDIELAVDFRQSNHEGVLVDWIHEAGSRAQGIVCNGGAYSHTSLAIHDALKAVGLPLIEVHLSNVYRREPFRHHSYLSLIADGVICGLGPEGYVLALRAMKGLVARRAGATA